MIAGNRTLRELRIASAPGGGAELPAGTVNARVFFVVGPHDALVVPLANCTS